MLVVNIFQTYDNLKSTEDLHYLEEDSDPEETHKVMSSLVLNTERCPSSTSRSIGWVISSMYGFTIGSCD